MNNIDESDVLYFIEYREIYDGWSVAKMKDGTYRNRWEPQEWSEQYKKTQVAIKRMENEDRDN